MLDTHITIAASKAKNIGDDSVFREEGGIQRGWAPQCALTFPDPIPPIRPSI
jgi:hypothetical protein